MIRTATSIFITFLIAILFVLVHTPGVYAKEMAIAMHNTRTEEIVWGIANRIKESMEKNTKGEITVKLFGPEMGGERDLLEATSRNEFQMVQSGEMAIGYYGPKYAVTAVPYVFPDYSAVRKAYEGKLGNRLNETLVKNGNIRLLGLHKRGARLLTGKKPFYTPEDIKGLKIRVPEMPTWVTVWKQIGALPTPVAWPEVFTALQTGVVEAQENPILQIYEAKLYEVQKYIMLTEHICGYYHWLVNDKFYHDLSPNHRKILDDAIKSATDWGTRRQEQKTEELCVMMQQKHGIQFIIPSKHKFFEAATPAVKKIADELWAPEVKDFLKEILGW
jgi:tripartite ATP-independent transporter DctP family solute receptor